jgi:hypothetical protein
MYGRPKRPGYGGRFGELTSEEQKGFLYNEAAKGDRTSDG